MVYHRISNVGITISPNVLYVTQRAGRFDSLIREVRIQNGPIGLRLSSYKNAIGITH